MIPDFINAAKIITENKKFFDEKTEYLKELKIQHIKRIEEFHSKRKVLKEQFDNKAIKIKLFLINEGNFVVFIF